MQYTQDQIDELIKCKDDPIYFIEKYVKTPNVERGITAMKLYPNQKKAIEDYHKGRDTAFRDNRQTGVTQSLVAYLCWWMTFNSYKTAMVMSHRQTAAVEILQRVLLAYDHLPEFLKKGLTTRNKTSIQFEDDTRIIASSPILCTLRGRAFDILMMDNYEFIQKSVKDEILHCVVPVISASKFSKFITASTR